MIHHSPSTTSLAQLLTPAIQRAIDNALLRHRKLGESIAIMKGDQIVILTGDEIPVEEAADSKREVLNNLQ